MPGFYRKVSVDEARELQAAGESVEWDEGVGHVVYDAQAQREGQRRLILVRLADWLYSEGDTDEIPIEQIEAELRDAGVDMEQAKVRMREMISRLSRAGS